MDQRDRVVSQGSVLGPVFWNVMYDAELRLTLQFGAQTAGFAGDIAVVVQRLL